MPVRRQEHAPIKDSRACPASKGTGQALDLIVTEPAAAPSFAPRNCTEIRFPLFLKTRYLLGMVASPDAQGVLPTAADVEIAARRLEGIALHTPLVTSPVLDARTGGRVFLKAETLQRTGSFKFRGAYNKLAALALEDRAGGVVAFSSGNHAQGVAAAAQLLGMPAVIVMPRDAPWPKRERTAALGAEIGR